MENIRILSLDDVVFSGRNQTYGAYMLRRFYGQRLMKGIVIGTSLAGVLLSGPMISEKIFGLLVKPEKETVAVVDLLDPPVKNEVTPPPPPPPPPQREQAKVVVLTVTVKETPKEQVTLPDPPKNVDIGTTELHGDTSSKIYVKPVEVAPPPPPVEKEVEKQPAENPNKVFIVVEQKPEFPNGDAAMFKYLHDNIKYPAVAVENGIMGTVSINFIVNTDGSIVDVKILRGVAGGCSEEALRVVNAMPKWKAGRQQGKAVRVSYTLPVKFYLQIN